MEKLKPKRILLSVLVLIFLLVFLPFAFYLIKSKKEKTKEILETKKEELQTIKEQLEEIEKLKEQFPPTTKSPKEQLEEIEKLRKKLLLIKNHQRNN